MSDDHSSMWHTETQPPPIICGSCYVNEYSASNVFSLKFYREPKIGEKVCNMKTGKNYKITDMAHAYNEELKQPFWLIKVEPIS